MAAGWVRTQLRAGTRASEGRVRTQRGQESRRGTEAWDSKDGAVSRPGRPRSAGPRGPSQECPVSTRPGSATSLCTGDGRGGHVHACVLRGGGRDAPQQEQPQAGQQAALPPRRTRTAPELARSPLPLRGWGCLPVSAEFTCCNFFTFPQ